MNAGNDVMDRLRHALGWAGVLALALTMVTIMFYFVTVAPARHKLAVVQAKAAELHAKLPKSAVARTDTDNPKARIDAYYGSFPGVEELPAAIADTLDTAKHHALAIDKADYSYEAGRPDELMALQMSFMVKGPYPKVRGFLMDLLRSNPAMSLDDVSFGRDGIASTEIEAKVRVTFYVTGVPWNRQSAAAG